MTFSLLLRKMAIPRSITSHISAFFLTITCFLCIVANPGSGFTLRNDSDSIESASHDYGNIVHETPSAVLYPSSVKDIIDLIKSSNNRSTPLKVAARGRGHSVRGQAMARGGVVVEMTSLNKTGIMVYGNSSLGFYADVDGGQMWYDVLRATLRQGLLPVSWTDYLQLTVGGTLSNAGVSGQAFRRGPQISNVLELDVVTGKGEFITCSKDKNPDLFFGVLGGLGQFGIITRARIVLDKAPTRAKWVRLLSTDFSAFQKDQEYLISSNDAPDYVEGLVLLTDEKTTNNYRSTKSNRSDVVSLLKKNNGLLYSIEFAKYYDNHTAKTIDKEFDMLLKKLHFVPNYGFSTDVPIFDFLNRGSYFENDQGLKYLKSHPCLNLFVPKSQISDFNARVLATTIPKLDDKSSVFLLYPFNRNKWDNKMSAVIPDEDVFYMLGLELSSRSDQYKVYDQVNDQILELCDKAGIKVKQYLPHFKSKQDWIKHYGSKWKIIQQLKTKFDPKMILSPGQGIYNIFN